MLIVLEYLSELLLTPEWWANQYFRISFKDHHGVSCCPQQLGWFCKLPLQLAGLTGLRETVR
jgi:hypothetical protein